MKRNEHVGYEDMFVFIGKLYYTNQWIFSEAYNHNNNIFFISTHVHWMSEWEMFLFMIFSALFYKLILMLSWSMCILWLLWLNDWKVIEDSLRSLRSNWCVRDVECLYGMDELFFFWMDALVCFNPVMELVCCCAFP